MKLRVRGFQLQFPTSYDPALLYGKLLSEPIHRAETSFTAAISREDYIVGVRVEMKDQRSSVEAVTEGGVVTVRAAELASNTSMADFSYFLLNTHRGRGLFTHYHTGITETRFAYSLEQLVRPLRNQQRDLLIGAADTKADKAQIRKEFQGWIKHAQILKLGSFIEHVRRLERIDILKAKLLSYAPGQNHPFQAIAAKAKKAEITYSFPPSSVQGELPADIEQALEHMVFEQLEVSGKDPHGFRRSYKLFRDAEIFHEQDFDEAAATVAISTSDPEQHLAESALVRMLEGLAASEDVHYLLAVAAPT